MLNFELEWELQACHEHGARKISCVPTGFKRGTSQTPLKELCHEIQPN